MTTPRRFEADLPALLADLYPAGTPDYRDDIVRRTARMRQRPAWTFPERWLPVELTSQRASVARMPWRQLGVLALIALLLATLLAVYIGSRTTHLPAPFGLAGNGIVVSDQNGDLYVRDDLSAVARVLLGGQTDDHDAAFSPDGTRLVFVRSTDGRDYLMTAAADGSDVQQLVDDPLINPHVAWAADSHRLAVVNEWGGAPKLSILSLDHAVDLAVPMGDLLPRETVWAPPDGRRLLVRAMALPTASQRETYQPVDFIGIDIGSDGTISTTPLHLDPHKRFGADWDNSGPSYSADGSTIAYNVIDPGRGGDAGYFRVHVVAADGTGDHALPAPAGSINEGWPAYSPDGSMILVHRWTWKTTALDGGQGWLAVMPADGSAPARDIGPRIAGGEDTGLIKAWSPDGTRVIVRANNTQQIFSIDPITGAYVELPWTAGVLPDWQRVAR
jgi:WD40-like Beta Propeller Repeat